MNQSVRNRAIYLVVAISIIGLILRLWLLRVTDSHSTDGIAYLSTVDYFLRSSEWTEIPKRITMPLYPAFAWTVYHVVNDIALAGRIANLVIGIAMIPMVFLTADMLFNRKIAFVASILVAIDWLLIAHSVSDRADLLFSLLTLLLIYFFWKIPWVKPNILFAVFFGILMGLTQLTRTNGVLYFSVFVVYWLIYAVRNRTPIHWLVLKTLIPVFVVYGVIAAIPVWYLDSINAPPQSYIGHTFLDGILTARGDREIQFYKLNEDATDFEMTEQIKSFTASDIWRLRLTIPEKYKAGMVFIGSYFTRSILKYFGWSFLIVIPLIILLIAKRRQIKGWDRTGYLLSFAIPFIFLLPIMHLQETFFVPLWCPFLMIVSWFLVAITEMRDIKKFGTPIAILIFLVLMFVNLQHLYFYRKNEASNVNGYRLAGEYLKSIKQDGDMVMSRDNTVYFYSGMRGYRPPSEPLERTLKYARHKGIDYFVLGPFERKERPDLVEEIQRNLEGENSDFELIKRETRGSADIYILKILDDQKNHSDFI